MLDILIKAGCFVSIIILGYILKQIGFFHEDDFKILSKIVIRLTLPAAIITSFAGKTFDLSLLVLILFGFAGGAIYILCGFLLNQNSSTEQKAFDIVNLPGYNIGNFTMPFIQSFLGPMGVIATSLFDTGNAFIVLGGSFGIASAVKSGNGFNAKRIIQALSKSVPFMSYVLMVTLSIFNLSLPSFVLEFAKIIGNANVFMAMLMIGVGFKLTGNPKQIGSIIKILTIRYGVAIILALCFYYLVPFALEIRQALVILAFSPIGSAVPAFTGELKDDVGLSSAINSISIIISILIIVILLIIML